MTPNENSVSLKKVEAQIIAADYQDDSAIYKYPKEILHHKNKFSAIPEQHKTKDRKFY